MTKLCAIVRTSDGVRVCEVVKAPIYDYKSLFPMMEVKAFEGKPLNVINRIMVPMAHVFTVKEGA